MPDSALFTAAMALTPAGDGVYDGELNEHRTIGPKVHGGAMPALCANAARTEHGAGGVESIALSGNFLPAPDPALCGWSLPCAGAGVGSASSMST
jgi:hypothetical protein